MEHGFRLLHVDDDELKKLLNPSSEAADKALYLDSASAVLQTAEDNLKRFYKLTGPLKFPYAALLREHFCAKSKLSCSSSSSSSSSSSLLPDSYNKETSEDEGNKKDQDGDEDEDDEEEGDDDDEEGYSWYLNSDGEKTYYTDAEIKEYQEKNAEQDDADKSGYVSTETDDSRKRKVRRTETRCL